MADKLIAIPLLMGDSLNVVQIPRLSVKHVLLNRFSISYVISI